MCKHAIAHAGLALAFAILLSCLLPTTAVAESYSADVVIVGAGGAGMAAAYEAASKGASVIVAELDSTYGGTAALSGGGCFAVGTPLQKKKGIRGLPLISLFRTGSAGDRVRQTRSGHATTSTTAFTTSMSGWRPWESSGRMCNFNEGNSVPRWHRPQGFGKMLAMKLYEAAEKAGDEKWLFDVRIERILKRMDGPLELSGSDQHYRRKD